MKIYGIKAIKVNGTDVLTVNVTINSTPTIFNRVINDDFWKNHHTIYMKNSKSKIHFAFTTLDYTEAHKANTALFKILFAHKVAKLYTSSYNMNDTDKKNLISEVIKEQEVDHAPFW